MKNPSMSVQDVEGFLMIGHQLSFTNVFYN